MQAVSVAATHLLYSPAETPSFSLSLSLLGGETATHAQHAG